MKRLLLSIVGAAFFALVGIEASHFHPRSVAPDCHACALGAQTARHAAADTPAISAPVVCVLVAQAPDAAPRTLSLSRASARAPPAA